MGKPVKYKRNFDFKYSHFGSDAFGHDIKAFGDTTNKYIWWDASADTFYVNGTLTLDGTFNADNLALIDAETLSFGTGTDVIVQFDGTDLKINVTNTDTSARTVNFYCAWEGNY